MNQQQREVEKALIGYSEYQLRPQYSSLAVKDEKWFRFSQEQCQQCIAKFNKATVEQVASSKELSSAIGNVTTPVVMSAQSKKHLFLIPMGLLIWISQLEGLVH